jgi:hypothetical protein
MWRSALPFGGIMTFFGAVALPLAGLKTARYLPPGTDLRVQLP